MTTSTAEQVDSRGGVGTGTRFGLMLPHFGSLATKERVIDRAAYYERAGIDSLWVRDHLTFQPHHFEPPSTTFFEPFTTLTAIAATTQRIQLGTATLVPMRHPLVASQLFGGLRLVAGPGRIIAGLGAGATRLPFEATGQRFEDRVQSLVETAQILRLTWEGPDRSYTGDLFSFENVTIDPRPESDTPIWIGGSSPAAVRRAIEYGSGWLPGRCPMATFDRLLSRVRAAEEQRSSPFGVGIMPILAIGRNRDDALKGMDVEGLVQEAHERDFFHGDYRTVDDLEGMLICGSPDDCVEQIGQFVSRGVNQVIFDLRMRLDDFDEQVQMLTEAVLPRARVLAGRPLTSPVR